jgi:hypothetical protein
MAFQPSPEHRRLRFSFQINDFKDQSGFPNPPYKARRRRGAGVLSAPNSMSTGFFEAFFAPPGRPGLECERSLSADRSGGSIRSKFCVNRFFLKSFLHYRTTRVRSAKKPYRLRGAGVLTASLSMSTGPFELFLRRPEDRILERKSRPGPPRSFPHQSGAIRLKAWNIFKQPDLGKNFRSFPGPERRLFQAVAASTQHTPVAQASCAVF